MQIIMVQEALKIELIEWMTSLNNDSALEYLKSFKESLESEEDWWFDLSAVQKVGIERGLQDIDEGRVTPHAKVAEIYGL